MGIEEPSADKLALLRRDDSIQVVSGFVFLFFFGMLLTSAGIVIWSVVQWLKVGEWPDATVDTGIAWMGMDRPWTSWAGALRILNWFLDLPLWLLPPLVGFAVLIVWLRFADRERDAVRVARMKRANWKRYGQGGGS